MDIWKTVYTVKKILLISVLFLLASLPLSAEKLSEVSLRQGVQDNNVRIVVESDEDFIKNSNVKFSSSAVIVEFPSRFELKMQKDFMFGVTKKDRSLVMTLKDITDFKTYRLSSPARLVFDLKIIPKKPADSLQKTDQKTQQQTWSNEKKALDPGKQSGQKTPALAPQVAPKNPLEAVRQEGQKTPPSPSVEKPRRKVVVIDPGHGGYDYGLVSQDAREKDAALILAKDLGNAFTKKGMAVFITRKADQNASLTDRINFSNSKNPDLFISLHSSSADKFVV
jgi:N-acetylmuramoyl-L-alanine amidase